MIGCTPIAVTTPDGVAIAAQSWGNPEGQEILFVHGFAQSHLCWLHQVADPALIDEFRMVTYDLRGHGGSAKPLGPAYYREGKRWADEVDAVMKAAELRRPVVACWSYGGRVVSDYLASFGAGRLAGINYVGATTKNDPAFFGDGIDFVERMIADDLATAIDGTRACVRACFAHPPGPDELETMLAAAMLVPPQVRRAMMGRPLDIDSLMAALRLPVLVTQGLEDRFLLPEAARHTAATIPGASLSLYESVGHTPFQEDAARFNAELAAFAEACRQG